MDVFKHLKPQKQNIRGTGFTAPESVHRRLEAMGAHYGSPRSHIICALINAHYEELVNSGEMTPETTERGKN